jgi:7-alpha-hydroxysteroid dehydrogenase
VRVNALAVGAVETDALSFVLASEELRRKMIELTPMGRLGQVEDVAAAALYLCSPAAAWVTGKVFEIDGGTVASSWPMKIKGY